jgi:hypothetical protein
LVDEKALGQEICGRKVCSHDGISLDDHFAAEKRPA